MNKKITIIGAGLVGSLLSIYLSKHGYQVSIYERRSDMRKADVVAGRSINLALSDRGIKALTEVGIAEEVLDIAIPMYGRQIHNADGAVAFQPYGKQGQHINAVSRRELNCKLMDLAERHDVKIYFDVKCSNIDWKEKRIQFQNTVNGELLNLNFELLFGADGSYSATRLAHMMEHEKFDYQQYYIDCGYKEITIPAGAEGQFILEKNALHIWPRKNYMLIALPNLNATFTGTLFFPFEGELSFARLTTSAAVTEFFQNTFPDVVKLIPDLANQFFQHPTSSLVTVKCFPWIRDDHFCLIGDAAHAIVPFFGQGMNAGFEDCSVLNDLIDKHKYNWQQIFNEFQELRKQDADAIADMAVNNFIEMREKTADSKFLLQKKIEAKLHEQHSDKWIPAYAQVTFNPQIRYSEALRNSQKQEEIMSEVMQQIDIEQKWDSEETEQLILSKI